MQRAGGGFGDNAAMPDETTFQAGRVTTVASAHAVHDTYSAFLPPLLPAFVERLSLSTSAAGLLTVFIQGPSLLQPVFGHLGDRVDPRMLVVLTPAVTAVCMSLLGVAPAYAALALLLTVAGTSSAVLHSVGPVVAGRLSGLRLGRGMSFWMVGGELGRTLGPLAVVSAVAVLGLGGLPWLMAAGIAASAVLFWTLRSVRIEVPASEGTRSGREALRDLRPLLAPLTGFVLARSFQMAAITTYLPLYLRERGASLWLAGASLTILEAAGVVGAMAAGTLSDRLGRRGFMLASIVGTPLLMLLLPAAHGVAQGALLAAMGLLGISVTPVVMAVVQEAAPASRSLANGVYMALSFGVRSTVILLVGALADATGMTTAFTVSAVVTLTGVPFALLLPVRPTAASQP